MKFYHYSYLLGVNKHRHTPTNQKNNPASSFGFVNYTLSLCDV